MININTLNQTNNFSLGKPNIQTPFSSLAMGETTTSSGYIGKLIPIFYKELQPSQSINTQQAVNIQFTPFVTNLMHQIKGELVTYFVPYRLLWDKWEDFVTGGINGTENPVLPKTSIYEIFKELKNLDETTSKGKKFKKIRDKVIMDISKGLEELDERIKGYTAQHEDNKKEAAEIAQSFGNFFKEILEKRPATLPLLFIKKAQYWYQTLNAFEQGYPYLNDTGKPDLLAHELNVFEKANKTLFTHTQWDYLGLPFSIVELIIWILEEAGAQNVNEYTFIRERLNTLKEKRVLTFPFDAYTKIYNDWIRLADWETEIETIPITLENANYDWDYFTRARRYQIRGAMPTIPVLGGQQFTINDKSGWWVNLVKDATGEYKFNVRGELSSQLELPITQRQNRENSNVGEIMKTSQNIEFTDIMTAAALMNYFTANAKIRPRYAEHLLARWNVRIQDARLQLSEFVGINEIYITSQGVVQTSAGGDGQTQQGNITGQLWGNGTNMQFNYKAQEHGIIITLMTIKPANSYELGYPAWLRKQTRFDMPIPEMVNLPDMPIKMDELDQYAEDNAIIGYKAIYDEYRTTVNKVTGLLRPSISDGLASYTMARRIHIPSIGKIVKCKPDMNRIKQYTNQPDFIFIIASSTQTAIPLPYTSDVQLAL